MTDRRTVDELFAGLVLLTSWRAMARTDELCALTDDLARTVTIG
ncbi:hypothetical protein [Streptomyces sp. NPDC006668]